MTTSMIIAKYHESTDWVKEYSDFETFIYNKSDKILDKEIPLPNIGREAHTYLFHIINNYNSLADVNIFTQADPGCIDFGFFRQDHKKYCACGSFHLCDLNGNPHHINLPLEKYYKIIFGENTKQKFLLFSAGAIFAVTRELIQKQPIEFYENLLNMCLNEPKMPWILERLWLYIFNNLPFEKEVNELYPNWECYKQWVYTKNKNANKSNMKIAIMLPYYKRPNLVRNALTSIVLANKNYRNWELLFHDDGSPVPGEPIVREILKDHLDKVKFYRTEYTSVEDKLKKGGILGNALNKMMKESDADVAFTLCDDDAIYPDYLLNLASYFTRNPGNMLCYSHVQLWNPTMETLEQALSKPHIENHFNTWTEPIFSFSKHDWSQIAWRLPDAKKNDIWYYSPYQKNHDAYIVDLLNKKFGPTPFSGCVGQLKAWWPKQQGAVDWPVSIRLETNIDG